MMNRDQSTNFGSVGPEITSMPSTRFPPPNGSLSGQSFAEASRKRKSMDVEPGHDGLSPRFLGNMGGKVRPPLQRDYLLQHNVTLPPSVDYQMLFNNNSVPHAGNAQSQYEAFQFYNMDNSLLTKESKDETIIKTSSGSLRPLHHNEPSFTVSTVRNIPETHDSRHHVLDITNQYEASKCTSHYRQHNSLTEMSQVALRSDDVKTFGHGNNSIHSNPCPYPLAMPFTSMATFGTSNLRAVNEIFHSDAGSFGQKFTQNGLFEEKECGQVIGFEEGRSISIGTTHCTQTSAFSEGRETYGAYQYHDTEIRSGISINNDKLGACSNLKEQNGSLKSPMPVHTVPSVKEGRLDHIPGGFQTKSLERAEGPTVENVNHSSGEETLFSGDSLAIRSAKSDDKLSLNLEEHTQSVAGKVSSLIAEKIWDGSLQLSTSTTVSAVAFFKSGEKAQGTKWSEHVEIKGKVRLQAFEKFIQELPRSRNRALMVISLCWKPGSPVAGLAGMKEVARGYKESQRVGFAQICPGFDLYVCPRSDTIITILAKYGFFKGMAAVEEDLDSLIGCVIWRRGHPSSNTVPEISEKKKTLLPDQQPSNSSELSVLEINSPITQVDCSGSKQEKAPSPLVSSGVSTNDTMAESQPVQSTDNSFCVPGSSLINSVSAFASMPYNSPLIQVRPPHQLESTSFEETMRDSEVPVTQAAELQDPNGSTQPVQPVLHGPPRILQGVPQQTKAQFSNGSYNFNYNSCPPPEPGNLVSLNSPFIRAQLPEAQNLDSSYSSDPTQTTTPELTPPSLPGPPPLTPDILHRILRFSRDAHQASCSAKSFYLGEYTCCRERKQNDPILISLQAPAKGMPKADPSFMPTGEQKKPSMGSEPEQKAAELDGDDDDGDLPEFDFDSACGVPKALPGELLGSCRQTHFQAPPFNQQAPVSVVRNESWSMPPSLMKCMDIRQTSNPSGFHGSTLGNYQGPGNGLPTRFGELDSEKKPADVPSSSQQFPGNKGSSASSSFRQKSRWDDDDDDMPEWCPPDLEYLNVPEPSTVTRILPPLPIPTSEDAKELPLTSLCSTMTIGPPLQSQSSSLGRSSEMPVPRPATVNPAPVHNRSAVGFVSTDFRPSQLPHRNHSMRPAAPNFGTKRPVSDGSWQWKRP